MHEPAAISPHLTYLLGFHMPGPVLALGPLKTLEPLRFFSVSGASFQVT